MHLVRDISLVGFHCIQYLAAVNKSDVPVLVNFKTLQHKAFLEPHLILNPNSEYQCFLQISAANKFYGN